MRTVRVHDGDLTGAVAARVQQLVPGRPVPRPPWTSTGSRYAQDLLSVGARVG